MGRLLFLLIPKMILLPALLSCIWVFLRVACSTYYILDDVYITPVFRRQGAAKQLIDTAILFAKHEQALRITLETQKNNYQSHKLYESMGFIKDDEFQTYHCFLK